MTIPALRDRRPPARRGALAALALAVAVAGSARADEAGTRFERIVAIGGAVTEIVFALGAGDRLVAVDSTSTYPPAAGDLPDVGYMRALSAEGVLSLAPDLILAIEGSGPKEAIAVLEAASVPLVMVPDGLTAEGVMAKIRLVAETIGLPRKGEELARRAGADLEALARAIATVGDRKRVAFFLVLEGARAIAAGSGSSAERIIELAGGENAFSGFSGYKAVSNEAIVEAAPDVVLTMARGDHARPAAALFANPALAATPAGREARAITMDGLYLLGFGPRTAAAARDLAHALYPELALPGLAAGAGDK